jgi:signal transduction histidine kinase
VKPSTTQSIYEFTAQVDALLQRAGLYISAQQYAKASQYLAKALAIANENQLETQKITVLAHLGEYYRAIGKQTYAIEYYTQAIALAESLSLSKDFYAVYQKLSELYKAQGEYELALQYLEQSVSLRDSVDSEVTDNKLKNIEARFRAQQAQQEAEQYRQRIQQLETLTHLKDDLISTTSHDLKNPLARIRLNTEILRRRERLTPEKIDNVLNSIDQASRMMMDLIGDVMDFVRLRAETKMQIVHQPLQPVLQETIEIFAPLADEAHITLTLDSNPAILANFNALDLRRALHNLVSNAIKYTPINGMVRLSAHYNHDVVLVTVCDTGDGIDDEDLPHLFEQFYRAKKHQKKEGTGLGLAITKRIIENQHGKIWVERNAEGGTCFAFTLPAIPY